MDKLTTERLEELANTTTPSVKYVGREMIEMARQILAYEQAAKNPVAWVVGDEEIADFKNGREVCVMRDCDDEQLDYLPLYAAPVLPKRPVKPVMFIDGDISSDDAEKLAAVIREFALDEVTEAQPVIPEQRQMVPDEVMPGGLVYSSALPEFESNDSDKVVGYHCLVHGKTRSVMTQEQAYSDAMLVVDACRAAFVSTAQPVIPEQWRSFVTDADIAVLHRFAECCEDPESGGHDLEKEQVQRLEKIGALRRSGRISYITDFGDYLISATAPINAQQNELQNIPENIPAPLDAQDLGLYVDMLENSDSDDEDGELNNTQLIVWLKELQRRRALPAQPVSEPYKLPSGWIKGQFAYQDLFNAIGAAVVSKHPGLGISVKAFEDSMLAAAPAQESE